MGVAVAWGHLGGKGWEGRGRGGGVGGAMSPGSARMVLKPVRTPVAILGSLGVCIYVLASRHWLISYSPIHLT